MRRSTRRRPFRSCGCDRPRVGPGGEVERPVRAPELTEELVVGALALLGVERGIPLAGRAGAAAEGLPEVLEARIPGPHVELRRLDLAVGREQVVDLPRGP